MRHQYLHCYYMVSGDDFFDLRTEIGPGKKCTALCYVMFIFMTAGDTVASRDRPQELSDEDIICYRLKMCYIVYQPCILIAHSPRWVRESGVIYQKTCALLMRVEDDSPVFGNLIKIYVVQNHIIFHVSLLKTSSFNVHLQAYTVTHTTSLETIRHSELLNPFPLHIHRVSSLSLIVCKHHICNTLS